jgi:hypothetical protein
MNQSRRTKMSRLGRILAALAFGAAGAVAMAGAYSEAHRAPDQS